MPVVVLGAVILEALAVAVMVLLLWLATPVLVKLLNWALGGVPVIGGYVSAAVATGLQAASGAIVNLAQASLLPLARALWSVTAVAWALTVNVVNGISDAKNFGIDGIVAGQAAAGEAVSLASAAESAAVGYTTALVGDATVELNNAVGGLEGLISSAAATAYQEVQAAEAASLGYTEALVGDATVELNNAVGGLEAQISATVDAASAFLQGQITNIDLGLTSLEQSLQAEIAAGATTAASEAVTAAQGAQTAAEKAILAGLPDIVTGPWAQLLPDLGTIVTHLPADVVAGLGIPAALSGVADGTVAGVLSGVVAAVGAVLAEEAECGVGLCENLSGLSGLLGELANGVALAGILAFLVEAASDPSQAASDVDALVGGTVSTITAGARDLIGA